MGALFEFKGVVKKVNPVQTFQSGFEKRDLVLTDDVGEVVRFPNIMCFTFKKERMKYLESLAPGMRVKIVFAIDGREWTDNSGNVRYFTDLTGIKLDVLASSGEQKIDEISTSEEPLPEVANSDEDLPF